MIAATEQDQEVLLLQSIAMSANLVFVNIDWKESRHHGTLKQNMMVLYQTIRNVVRNMNSTMICMCEVGVVTSPLTEKQMRGTCSCHRILWNLYPVDGQQRTAQTFLCCGPGDLTVDVINVHVPSRKKKAH